MVGKSRAPAERFWPRSRGRQPFKNRWRPPRRYRCRRSHRCRWSGSTSGDLAVGVDPEEIWRRAQLKKAAVGVRTDDGLRTLGTILASQIMMKK
jgi:hypothetical protein